MPPRKLRNSSLSLLLPGPEVSDLLSHMAYAITLWHALQRPRTKGPLSNILEWSLKTIHQSNLFLFINQLSGVFHCSNRKLTHLQCNHSLQCRSHITSMNKTHLLFQRKLAMQKILELSVWKCFYRLTILVSEAMWLTLNLISCTGRKLGAFFCHI